MSRKVCLCGHSQESHAERCRFHVGQATKNPDDQKYCPCKAFDELKLEKPLVKAREWKPSPPVTVVLCPICKRGIGRNAEAVKVRDDKREIVGFRHRGCAA